MVAETAVSIKGGQEGKKLQNVISAWSGDKKKFCEIYLTVKIEFISPKNALRFFALNW